MRIYSASHLRTKWRSLLAAWALYPELWLALRSRAERREKWRMTLLRRLDIRWQASRGGACQSQDFSSSNFPLATFLYQTTGGIGNPRISPKGDLIAFLELPLGTLGRWLRRHGRHEG